MDLTVLDAGVLIAVLNADDVHHDRARKALAALRDRGDRLVVPASAYAEILVAPLRQSTATGDAVEIAFNARFLADVLNVVHAPQVVIETSGSTKPGVFKIVGREDFMHVIMPMHLPEAKT